MRVHLVHPGRVLTSCCCLLPVELRPGDVITSRPERSTCAGLSGTSQPQQRDTAGDSGATEGPDA